MRKLLSTAAALALFLGVTVVTSAQASATPCYPVWSVGLGGFTISGPGITGEDSRYLDVNQPVGHNSADPQSGINELTRLINLHRAQCPHDHILVLGHSEGALVAHVWASRAGSFPNLNMVLIADPKRPAGPGGPGFSAVPPLSWLPYPYSGADNLFGDIPVLEICHPTDHVCNSDSDWNGYFNGVHNAYDFHARDYSTTETGLRYE